MVASGLNVAAEQVIEHSAYGTLLERQGNRGPAAAPQGLYACADTAERSGEPRWVAIAVEDDAQWDALRRGLGQPAWTGDPRLCHEAGRRMRHDELDAHLAAWCGARTAKEVVAALWSLGVPVAPVLTCSEPAELEQLQARGFFEIVHHPVSGSTLHTTYPVRISGGPDRLHRRAAPTMGQDNRAVLCGLLGVTDEEFDRLAAADVVGEQLRT
jgi:crotonobetainyl-CoA:carnitine CoA-transferase CaiB-like acyl-CoA transferase